MKDATLEFGTHPPHLQYIRFVVLEEMVALGEVFSEAAQLDELDTLRRTILHAPDTETK